MIRTDGYYISEAFPWVDWHAGHKFEGTHYYVMKFLSNKKVTSLTFDSKCLSKNDLKEIKAITENNGDDYKIYNAQIIIAYETVKDFAPVEKVFTILSPDILLDKNLKEYKFIPFDK